LPGVIHDEIGDAQYVSDHDSDKDAYRDDDEAIQLALFRYGVIGELVERESYAPGEVTALVAQIVERTHYLPGRGPVRVSERTVYAWRRRYRTGGIEALRPRIRSDCGIRRVLDDAVLARAIELRKEVPGRWTSTLLDILAREGTLLGKPMPHRATLDRHLAQRGASRRQLRVLGNKRTIKMYFENFGDLWVGDYKHGPVILAPDGKLTTAKLGAFLDHATRYPVADRWYLAEDLASLRDTLLRAFLVWGPAKLTYVDRGAVYRAEQLAYSLARLGKKLVHSRAYYSQGRGVIERWWQLADAFIAEVRTREQPYTLHELNRLWEAFRELRYCDKVHSALGKTPNDAVAAVEPTPVSPQVARELFLVGAKRTVHKKTACVSVEARAFLCESFLRGQRVVVRYDPNDFGSVLIFRDGKRVQRAFPQPVGGVPEPHPEPAEAAAQSVDYLALLRDDFDTKLLEHARPLAYADLELEDDFDLERFVTVVCDLAGLKAQPAVRRELASFWDTYGPLPEQLVRIATEHAVRLHTRGRHVRIYLHAIRTLVLAHLATRNPDNRKDTTS
jgi:transposase InsO family protein